MCLHSVYIFRGGRKTTIFHKYLVTYMISDGREGLTSVTWMMQRQFTWGVTEGLKDIQTLLLLLFLLQSDSRQVLFRISWTTFTQTLHCCYSTCFLPSLIIIFVYHMALGASVPLLQKISWLLFVLVSKNNNNTCIFTFHDFAVVKQRVAVTVHQPHQPCEHLLTNTSRAAWGGHESSSEIRSRLFVDSHRPCLWEKWIQAAGLISFPLWKSEIPDCSSSPPLLFTFWTVTWETGFSHALLCP